MTQKHTRSAAWALAGASVAYCVGNTTGWVSPSIVYGAGQRYGVSDALAGMLCTVELLLIGLVSILLGNRPSQVSPRRAVLFGAICVVMFNACSAVLPSFWLLLVARAMAGIGAGVALYFSIAYVAREARPERGYAILNVVNNLYCAILLATLPVISPKSSGLAYLPYSAVLIALFVPLLAKLPKEMPAGLKADAATRAGAALPGRAVTLLLAATFAAIPLSSFTNFSFAIPLGQRAGLTESQVNLTLGIGSVISTLGALVSPILALRLGRLRPTYAALALGLIANVMMVYSPNSILFCCATVGNLAVVYFVLPLLLGYAAGVDGTGGVAGIANGAFVASGAISPFVGGLISRHFTLGAFAPLAVVCFGSVLLFVFLVERLASSLRGSMSSCEPI